MWGPVVSRGSGVASGKGGALPGWWSVRCAEGCFVELEAGHVDQVDDGEGVIALAAGKGVGAFVGCGFGAAEEVVSGFYVVGWGRGGWHWVSP